MRKHYVTAVLGILFIAFLVAMHTDYPGAANAGTGISQVGDAAAVSLGNKIISGAANAVSFVAERMIDLLTK